MIADGREEWRDTPCFLSVYVDDCRRSLRASTKSGATQVTEMTTFNILGDRTGRVRDPFGNIWWIQTHLRDVSPEETAELLQDPQRDGGHAENAGNICTRNGQTFAVVATPLFSCDLLSYF
jgi:hypothetical protein